MCVVLLFVSFVLRRCGRLFLLVGFACLCCMIAVLQFVCSCCVVVVALFVLLVCDGCLLFCCLCCTCCFVDVRVALFVVAPFFSLKLFCLFMLDVCCFAFFLFMLPC